MSCQWVFKYKGEVLAEDKLEGTFPYREAAYRYISGFDGQVRCRPSIASAI